MGLPSSSEATRTSIGEANGESTDLDKSLKGGFKQHVDHPIGLWDGFGFQEKIDGTLLG